MRPPKSALAALCSALPAFLSLGAQAWGQAVPVYRNPAAPLEARVSDLFARLTPDEKLTLLMGTDFTTAPLPRLGVPAMEMADAGQGVRGGTPGTLGPATLFPAGVTMASTWDPALVGRIGQGIGQEALNKGTGSHVMLGPAVNIQRSPLGGRNGEYFSEDPFLTSRLAVGYIQGMQSTGCGACIKHFACNNQETDRFVVDVRVDERTLREIYLPAFEAGVKQGHVWTIMAAYNRLNGPHATASPYLLTDVLKKDWGWDGLVMSDWGAVHETVGVVTAGNDLEMPGRGYLAPARLAKALRRGQITQAEIEASDKRILRAILRVGLLDGPHTPDPRLVNSPAHRQLAFEAATQGIVLLKNAGHVLPLSGTALKSIALIGTPARDMQFGATGSPSVTPLYSVSPLDGITQRAGKAVSIRYAPSAEGGDPIPPLAFTLPFRSSDPGTAHHGLQAEYFANKNLEGPPALTRTDADLHFDWQNVPPAPAVPRTSFSARWNALLTAPVTGRYTLSLTADDGCRLFVDGKKLIDHWVDSAPTPLTAAIDLVAGRAYPLRVEYFQSGGGAVARLGWILPGQSRFEQALRAARASDVAVVFAGTAGTEGEGSDRPSLALPGDQDALIRAVAAANKKTIVVLNNGTPVLMTGWLRQVPGLVEAWLPGQEGGRALAALLFGDVNPSGKLPTTLAARREDYPDFGHYPGVNGQVDYAEGIYVGYRHFDKAQIAPLFPFGYGLSYTTFRYGPLKLSSAALASHGTLTVTVPVTNTGTRAGAEVVELYVHDPHPKIDKAVRELKAFGKVMLLPGQTKRVTLALAPRALAYCDVPGKQWKADAGDYDLEVGASSRDIRQRARLHLAADFTEPIPHLGATPPAERAQGDPNDLALNRPAFASSVQDEPGLVPGNVTDGSPDTRWASRFSDPQWIAVDLGRSTTINRVRLTWEDAYAASYAVQVSPDGKTWTTVSATQNGQGDAETATFAPVMARWVRVYGTKRGSTFGYSLFSFEVFAPGH